MNLVIQGATVVAGTGLGWLLTAWARSYALQRGVLDVPNSRSSHVVPVPRGGGLSIALVTVAGIAMAGLLGWIPATAALALAGGGGMVSVVGWIDDRGGVPPAIRGAVHFVAALWAVSWIGGVSSYQIGTSTVDLGSAGTILAVFGVVWFTNLFNFMDGIDGIAGLESVVAGSIGGGLLWVQGEASLAAVALLVSASSAGFLAWNWPPAKIFMGDVGSGLLGFLFGTLALVSEKSGAVSTAVWVLLLGVFVFDATATLIRRVLRGHRWYDAHRLHAYQRAVDAGFSHAVVTCIAGGLTLLLGILAAVSVAFPPMTVLCLFCGTVVLGGVYAGAERLRPVGA